MLIINYLPILLLVDYQVITFRCRKCYLLDMVRYALQIPTNFKKPSINIVIFDIPRGAHIFTNIVSCYIIASSCSVKFLLDS